MSPDSKTAFKEEMLTPKSFRLLESFMYPTGMSSKKNKNSQEIEWLNEDDARERAKIAKAGIWSFQPGSLTIVDLSCPFVDESAACSMFNICLSIFLEGRKDASRIVALDEAHKVRASPHALREVHVQQS